MPTAGNYAFFESVFIRPLPKVLLCVLFWSAAVAHGGNPHRPWRLPLGEDRAALPLRLCVIQIHIYARGLFNRTWINTVSYKLLDILQIHSGLFQ
ncbi:hypothetical protein FACHB389_10470 [Nostoc calcicola FACHB-389]|nr:hypothetical protein FACHB389_10470 [Nostoc calcicola FACHB-389]